VFLLRLVRKTLAALSGDAEPGWVAAGVVLGMFLGLAPLNPPGVLAAALLLALVRVNVAMFLVSFGLFSLLSGLLAPMFHRVGRLLLVDAAFLKGLWRWLYDLPVVPWSDFNNTVTLGALSVSLAACVPVFLLVRRGVTAYRATLAGWVEKTRIGKVLRILGLSRLFGGLGPGG